jgi:Na+:H+ antiporter, NhaA family
VTEGSAASHFAVLGCYRASVGGQHPSQPEPPEAWLPLFRLARLIARPLDRFLHIEASSGVVLLAATALALACANSDWADVYRLFWHAPIGVRVGSFVFERSLEWVVNDVLMAIFFFVVGLEIRGEIHEGELSEPRRALLPAAAALGGMIVPAGLYLAFAGGRETHAGWGVPMATDIAFALGILALLGPRVPAPLRVLLLTLAVIDDLGAIVVIALFYSGDVHGSGFLAAALSLLAILLLQAAGVRHKLAYALPAFGVWAGVYAAGVHPTIAGVIIGLVTPVRAWREPVSPAESLIEKLHPWVAFAIMPCFALANAGVSLAGLELGEASAGVAFGIGVGLVLGKPIGVLLASLAVLKLGAAVLPRGLGVRHLLLLGVVAGIGFTMSLFIAQLAFVRADLLAAAKLGVLAASALAAVLGLGLGVLCLGPRAPAERAVSADEAESLPEA